jgi:hypothetical protein
MNTQTVVITPAQGSTNQKSTYIETLTHEGRHLRTTVITDSYVDQGSAQIEILGLDLRWSVLAFVHPRAMKSDCDLGYKMARTPDDYHSDALALRNEAVRLMAVPK